MSGRGSLAALVVIGCLGGTARADDLTDDAVPAAPAELSMAYQLQEHLQVWGNELGTHLNTLSFNLVDMRFDAFARRAKLRLGGELGSQLSLRINGDIHFQHGLARVKTRVELGVVGHRFNVELPEFEMVPQSWAGERWVEVRLPLLEGHF